MRIARGLDLILSMLRIRLGRQMMYRASFWTAFFVDTTLFLVQLAFFSTLFLQVDSINGWSREQLVFFVGTFSLVDGLEMLLYFFGLSSIPEKIRTGKLDLYLTKPISPLFHITFESLDVGSGFLTLPGLVMVVWATVKMGIPITIGRLPCAAGTHARAAVRPDADNAGCRVPGGADRRAGGVGG
jgi:ABC-2 type transport system permease protein